MPANVSATDNNDAQNENITLQADDLPVDVPVTSTNHRPRREKHVPMWMHDYVTFNDPLEDDALMEDG